MLIKNRRWLCDLDTMDFDPGGAKKYAPRDRLMCHRTRGGCMDEPLKRIRSAWCQQCHTEGGRVDTIGVLGRPGSPGARWGAAGSATTCPGPPPSSSSSSPGLTPLLPSLQTHKMHTMHIRGSWSPNSTVLHLDIYLLSWWWGALWAWGIFFQRL